MHAKGRRHTLTTIIVGAALAALPPSRGHAQGYLIILRKLPWVKITEGVAAGLSIIVSFGGLLRKSEKPSAICKISESDLASLGFRCRELALSLDALDFEPTTENGNQGAIPALITYKREPDERHWKWARSELARLLADAEALLSQVQRIAGPDMQWSSVNVRLPDEDLQKVAQALRVIKPSLEEFTLTWDQFSPSPSEDAQELIDLLAPIPKIAAGALVSIGSLQEARMKATCT